MRGLIARPEIYRVGNVDQLVGAPGPTDVPVRTSSSILTPSRFISDISTVVLGRIRDTAYGNGARYSNVMQPYYGTVVGERRGVRGSAVEPGSSAQVGTSYTTPVGKGRRHAGSVTVGW